MNSVVSNKQIKEFQKTIWDFYRNQGRLLPWRETSDPYKILVSEIMLQQTQVSRVLPKYNTFLKVFPSVQALAQASLQEVLSLWVGLGYNRRAKFLHQAAQQVVNEHNGIFPNTSKELQTLPGIGPYTASAVSTFAYNNKEVLIETNLRTVYIHRFFVEAKNVPDIDILSLIKDTLPIGKDVDKPSCNAPKIVSTDIYKHWYWALMDYGSHLKEILPNPSRKSKHHTKQSKFKGSLREARGLIIRVLSAGRISEPRLSCLTAGQSIEKERFIKALDGLKKEGFIEAENGKWQLTE